MYCQIKFFYFSAYGSNSYSKKTDNYNSHTSDSERPYDTATVEGTMNPNLTV